MRFPKKTNLMLILFLIALSFVLRFPSTPHSLGIDAFVMQNLANTMAHNGFAAWIMHPLSFLGLYPLSYPSGGIFLTANVIVLTGTSSEVSIMLLSFMMGLIGVLGSYMLAREFRDDDLFAFIVAFLFCLAPKFILNTTWETPTRGGFMAFTPIFLWSLLRAHRDPNRKNIALPILFLFILATFHRLALLMLIVILAYISAYFFFVLVKIAKMKMPAVFLKPKARKRMRLFGVIALLALAAGLVFGSGVLDSYETGRVMTSDEIPVQLFNLGVSLTRSSGVLAPFLLVGAVVLAYQRNKTLKESFILFVVLAIIPTLYLRRYTGFYVPVFLSLLAGMGVIGIMMLARKRKRATAAVFIAMLVGSLGLTGMLLDYESETSKYMSMEQYGTGLYASQYVNGTIFSNNGLLVTRISAVSGLPYLPIGGATVSRSGPEQLAFGFVDVEDIHVTQIPLEELTLNSDHPFLAYGVPNAQREWRAIHDGFIDDLETYPDTDRYLREYNIYYALEDSKLPSHFMWSGPIRYSRFLGDPFYGVHNVRYKMYESERNQIWSL
ncbi:MAG: hypothetical protein E3J35_04125 [Methanomassiliicoccales archaeon]|nr:MAG: hypothetical protein E3J35_04125 [Methanomassiliicoccales archaeon]